MTTDMHVSVVARKKKEVVGMDVGIREKIGKKESQLIFGELKTEVKAIVKNAEEIARRTGGKIWIDKVEGTLYVVLDYEPGCVLLRDAIMEELKKAIMRKVKEQKSREVELDVSELDWDKINKVIQKVEEEKRKKEEQARREKEAQEKLNSFVARFNSEHEEIQVTSIPRMCRKVQVRIEGYSVSDSIYIETDEVLSDDFTYERFSALVHEKIIKELKKIEETEKESREKLEQENELMKEFIAEHHSARELAEWLAEKKKNELEREAWDEVERLVPELFEDEDEDGEEW